MNIREACTTAMTFAIAFAPMRSLRADPCGMVPPIRAITGSIQRTGLQKTYVFYKNGIETFVIRPGFQGKVEEFGMLIPFPSPPSVRKVGENVFPHVAAAIDPPEVVVDLRVTPGPTLYMARSAGVKEEALSVADSVRVVRQEAVGMYEVAVLEAGSAAALQRWMEHHGYRYPKGMDKTCEDYIAQKWCFVAVKTRVGAKAGVDARPGMRSVRHALPAGGSFDGHVQAMGFRFRTKELVVPMRLSAFNGGSTRNIVYLLTDQPSKVKAMPDRFVVRQVPGHVLYRNVTDPLPLRIVGGTIDQIPDWRRKNLKNEQNPEPHNGIAKTLFASDLLAAQLGRLVHPHETKEKALLRIGEELGLRDKQIDAWITAELAKERKATLDQALAGLRGMTLSVIDGEFPREQIAKENITFAAYRMGEQNNRPETYDAKVFGPAPKRAGVLAPLMQIVRSDRGLWAVIGLLGLIVGFATIRRGRARATASLVLVATLCVGAAPAQSSFRQHLADLGNAAKVDVAVQKLVEVGAEAVPHLVGEAIEGRDLERRGWAIVCLSRIGGASVDAKLTLLHEDAAQPRLVRAWAAAARVRLARAPAQLQKFVPLLRQFPALQRPIGLRLRQMLGSEDRERWIEPALVLASQSYPLQVPVLQALRSVDAARLVSFLAHASMQVRRQAAAYLASLAQTDAAVARRVIDHYRYRRDSKVTPWDGGALFVPGLAWTKEDARALTGELMRWMIWCDHRDLVAQQKQLHNNLRSLNLARVAGYKSPGWSFQRLDGWLKTWNDAFGAAAVNELIESVRR